MTRPDLEDAFGHHVWATLQLLDVCDRLTPDQLATPVPGTYGSILDTMRHTVGADAGYLFRLTGGRVSTVVEETMDLSQLRAVMERDLGEWSALLAAGVDPDIEVVAVHDDGSRTHAPVGIRLAQALHHGTDHRSQICTGLTALGIEPPEIDVWAYGATDGRVVEEDPPGGS
ncbi:MAG TPA: DinB family protein [Actinomycetota bacterium]|nr:DinB family protein [Actinomycetota bacterium]